MSRPAFAILSSQNLLHNLNLIKKLAAPAKIIAMVKANAYGHGIRSVALRLDGLVDMLGVASIDEALILQQIGIKSQIILMQGIFNQNELISASEQNFAIVFNNALQIQWLESTILPKPISAWLKINTGMNRLGFEINQGKQIYYKLIEHKNILPPVKIMSHFACADNSNSDLNTRQIQNFYSFTKELNTELSISNSAAILNFKQCNFDYVRPGLLLYGVSPIHGKYASDFGAKPVMSLQSSLTAIQNCKKGDSIGYGAEFICPENMPIGIIAFGYGDGYPITAKSGAPILVNDRLCSLVGRVSMDMIAVDLRPCAHAKIGDKVELWGQDIPLELLSRHTANIPWSILTGIQHRVKFIWT